MRNSIEKKKTEAKRKKALTCPLPFRKFEPDAGPYSKSERESNSLDLDCSSRNFISTFVSKMSEEKQSHEKGIPIGDLNIEQLAYLIKQTEQVE